MASRNVDSPYPLRGWNRVVLVAVYLAALGIAARLLTSVEDASELPWYLSLLALYFILYSVLWIWPGMRPRTIHAILAFQCLLVLGLLVLEPELDYATSLLVPLGYQAVLVFQGRVRWVWAVALVVLAGASLMITLGPLRGLGLGLSTMAIGLALPALALASREIEVARVGSRELVAELEEKHRRLEAYVVEVNDLAVIEERNRLARELHDSVSQAMFGVVLATRSAQMMRENDPEGVKVQLERTELGFLRLTPLSTAS